MNAKQRKLIYRILPYAILTGIGICFVFASALGARGFRRSECDAIAQDA